MAKAPVPRNVKTRLRFPPESLHLIGPLLPVDARLVVQRGEDLGERMLDAASCLFEEGPEPVVILGTDAPTLPLDRIEEAAHALNAHDASIVPSEDGGYVLIGLRNPCEALFRDIAWSTETVYRETMTKARRAGLSVHKGATHYDVDTPEDLARLKAELQEYPELSLHTAELVKTL